MQLEELKLILETVESTTGEAKAVAAWWLAVGAFKSTLPAVVFVSLFVMCKRIALQLIRTFNDGAANEILLDELSREIGREPFCGISHEDREALRRHYLKTESK